MASGYKKGVPLGGFTTFNINDPDVVTLDPNSVLDSATQVGNTVTIGVKGGIASNAPEQGAAWFVPLRDRYGERLVFPTSGFVTNIYVVTPPSDSSDVWVVMGLTDDTDLLGGFNYGGLHYDDVGPDPRIGSAAIGPNDLAADATGVGHTLGIPIVPRNVAGQLTTARLTGAMYDSSETRVSSAQALNTTSNMGASPYVFLAVGRSTATGALESMTIRPGYSALKAFATYITQAIP